MKDRFFARACPHLWAKTPVTLRTLAILCLFMPNALLAQERAIRDVPTVTEIFEGHTGYEMFSSERHGRFDKPLATELGFSLVLRMFRNICLGLERGAPLAAVTPEGFEAYNFSPYFFGPETPPRGDSLVLSSTGDIARDEDEGRPAIWLDPGTGGMTCTMEWRIVEDVSPQSQQAIAELITAWMPWELSLVRASKPLLASPTPLFDAIEWDRPCQGRWCPAMAIYDLTGGMVTLRMTLNIMDVEGEVPR